MAEEVTYLDSGACKSMGGDANTLVYYCQPVDPELQCGICLGTVDDPVSCGHECIGRYCHGCLSRAIHTRNECPTCKRETRRPMRDLPLKARLGRMTVWCPKSQVTQLGQVVGEGCCGWSGPLEQWNAHNQNECVYSTTRCLCDKDILRSELAAHQEICFQQFVRCRGCQTRVTLGEIRDHVRECPDARVQCNLCGERIPRRMAPRHLELHHFNLAHQIPVLALPPPVVQAEAVIQAEEAVVHMDQQPEEEEEDRMRVQQRNRQRRFRESSKTAYLNLVERFIINNPHAEPSLKTFLQENRNRPVRNPFNVIYISKFRQRCDVLAHPSPTGEMLQEALREYWDADKGRKRQRREAQEQEQE